MKKYVPYAYKTPEKIYDTSVYKTTKTSLRCSISPKVDQEENTIREAYPDTIEILLNNPEINYNLRMAPTSTDIFINLKPFIDEVLHNPEIKLSQKQLLKLRRCGQK